MIDVVIDYDNDSIRIGDDRGTVMQTIKLSCSPIYIENILGKIFNAIRDSNDHNIALSRQSDGTVTHLENF